MEQSDDEPYDPSAPIEQSNPTLPSEATIQPPLPQEVHEVRSLLSHYPLGILASFRNI